MRDCRTRAAETLSYPLQSADQSNRESRALSPIIEWIYKTSGQKTLGKILGATLIGALIAGASEADAQHLYEYGKNIGIAFQLQDDILDSFGDPEKFGKKVGGDIAQNKKTFLLIKALELAEAEADHRARHVTALRDRLRQRLSERLGPGFVFNTPYREAEA